jgi:hypothetical protein
MIGSPISLKIKVRQPIGRKISHRPLSEELGEEDGLELLSSLKLEN